ncbi:MFS transporter [Cupriavidus necator]|uniref:MFS transporter n=1 Tax=Cupriavidus necator TaxID=106590 RepID=UPI003ED17181
MAESVCFSRPGGNSLAASAASHRWKVLGVGVAANASFIAAANGLPATAVWLRSAYQIDNGGLGLLLGALGIGAALSELPWGAAADRWGDRRVLLYGLGATALILAVMALFLAPRPDRVPPLPVAMACMALLGLAGGSVNGASGRAVMRWFAEGERGLAMSIRQTAVPLGGGLGALVLPWLAFAMGFRWVYAVLAAFCFASAWLTWRWLHEPTHLASPTSARRHAHDNASPLRSLRVWRIAVAIGILCAPQFAVLSFASVFLHDAAHVGVSGIAATLCAVQLGAMAMRIWSGRHTDRRGNRRVWLRHCTLIAALMFVPLALCAAVGQSVPATLTMVAVVLAGIAVSAWHGVAYTELATQAGAERAGTALGLANTLVFAAYFAAPAAIPLLLDRGGWAGVWLLAGACAATAWPLFPRAGDRPSN